MINEIIIISPNSRHLLKSKVAKKNAKIGGAFLIVVSRARTLRVDVGIS